MAMNIDTTEEGLSKLIAKGLAGDIEKLVASELSKITNELVERQIEAVVKNVVASYLSHAVDIRHDPMTGFTKITIIFNK